MKKSFRYRIYPSKSQETALENTFSMCRHLYNWSLAERKETWEKEERSVGYQEQQNQLPALKAERPWFTSVYSQVLQDVLKRLEKAYEGFFRHGRGYPKFRKRGQWNSICYPQFRALPTGQTLYVPKIGKVEIRLHRPLPENAQIKTLTIIQEGTRWFACFSVDYEVEPKPATEPKQWTKRAVGLDLGLKDYYYASDGTTLPVPRFFRRLEQRLQKLSRKFAEAVRGSPLWRKLLSGIQKLHWRIRCQRLDFLHKAVNALLKRYDLIIHEDLTIANLMRRPALKQDEEGHCLPNGAAAKGGLNKSIADAAWGEFLFILHYKAAEQGKRVIAVAAHHTTSECSACHQWVPKSLSERTHHCPHCGFVANRDYNASLNILRRGLASLGLLTLDAPTKASA